MGYSFSYKGIMANINNEDAFRYCVHEIYPFLNYIVLQEDDVRRIDLAEKLYEIQNVVNEDIRIKGSGSTINYYAYLLKIYMTEYAETQRDTREERYYKRAMDIIDGIDKSEYAFKDIKDAFLIFISLFRSHKNRLDMPTKYYATAKIFDFNIEDSKLLVEIFNRENLTPSELVGKSKHGTAKDSYAKKKFFFVNSVVMLAYGLQERGNFAKRGLYE